LHFIKIFLQIVKTWAFFDNPLIFFNFLEKNFKNEIKLLTLLLEAIIPIDGSDYF